MNIIHLVRFGITLSIVLFTSSVFAQSQLDAQSGDRATQMNVIQSVLDAKFAERKILREQILVAGKDEVEELEAELKEINGEIADARDSFEQLAVGSVDLGIFNNDSGEFDWRTEMTEVLMPIIRNLQALTEKPRKIEALRSSIRSNNEKLTAANEAIAAIDESLAAANNVATKQTLNDLQTTWKDRAQEFSRNIDIANVRLNNLQTSNGSFFQSLKTGLVEFTKGRGLTLALAIAVALAVWYIAKYLTKLLTTRSKGEEVKTFRTRQRLVQYTFSVLTALLMTIAVIVVFYIRGDVLLLGVSFLVAGATLLGLRHAIPRFISEARLLLNLGSIREDERVVYNGLPYRVAALNMYSILKNPELTGVVRLPLENMMGMVSRPAGKEVWFPASKGDYIMLSDGKLLEVIELTTELIQLQNLAGTKTSIPASDFYNMTFDNLTRGDKFSIVGTFGVGYSHQSISNNNIPAQLRDAVADALTKTDISEHVISVAVELKEAGASSLDYWVCVTMSSDAVRSYFKISRIIQQTCVDTCTKEQWDIPFPQLTIHNQ